MPPGLEQYGAVPTWRTYNGREQDQTTPTFAGYSERIVVDENYVLHIPENLPLHASAPLLCAAITLYSPLKHWSAGPGKKIAVVGPGGLGHMGVKLGHAMGAEVTVLSQSLRKKDDGIRMGRVTTMRAVTREPLPSSNETSISSSTRLPPTSTGTRI
jgi:uncharacterized zinc-type alcohol dehydrogenase-like protein